MPTTELWIFLGQATLNTTGLALLWTGPAALQILSRIHPHADAIQPTTVTSAASCPTILASRLSALQLVRSEFNAMCVWKLFATREPWKFTFQPCIYAKCTSVRCPAVTWCLAAVAAVTATPPTPIPSCTRRRLSGAFLKPTAAHIPAPSHLLSQKSHLLKRHKKKILVAYKICRPAFHPQGCPSPACPASIPSCRPTLKRCRPTFNAFPTFINYTTMVPAQQPTAIPRLT